MNMKLQVTLDVALIWATVCKNMLLASPISVMYIEIGHRTEVDNMVVEV